MRYKICYQSWALRHRLIRIHQKPSHLHRKLLQLCELWIHNNLQIANSHHANSRNLSNRYPDMWIHKLACRFADCEFTQCQRKRYPDMWIHTRSQNFTFFATCKFTTHGANLQKGYKTRICEFTLSSCIVLKLLGESIAHSHSTRSIVQRPGYVNSQLFTKYILPLVCEVRVWERGGHVQHTVNKQPTNRCHNPDIIVWNC